MQSRTSGGGAGARRSPAPTAAIWRSALRAAPLVLLLALIGALALAPDAGAASCEATYVGDANGLWNRPGNWSGGALPQATQAVCIPAGAGVIRVPKAFTAHARTLRGESGVEILAGGRLALAEADGAPSTFEGLVVASGGVLSTIDGPVRISGRAIVDGEVTGSASGRDEVVLEEGAMFTGTGSVHPTFAGEGGVIYPGRPGAVGTLTFFNSFHTSEARLVIDLSSATASDRVIVKGDAFLEGPVEARPLAGYAPALRSKWAFMEGPFGVSISGEAKVGDFEARESPEGAEMEMVELARRAPQPPTLQASAGDAQALLKITPPTDHGTAGVERYELTIAPGGRRLAPIPYTRPSPAEAVLAALRDCTTYTARAFVTTSVATSAPSPPVSFTPQGAAGCPAGTARAGSARGARPAGVSRPPRECSRRGARTAPTRRAAPPARRRAPKATQGAHLTTTRPAPSASCPTRSRRSPPR